MSGIEFTPATRQQLKAKVATFGPSKSGKTLSSLLIARGVVGAPGRIAAADTEGDRIRLYAGHPLLATPTQPSGFDHFHMTAPFTADRFVDVVRSAVDAGYDALVVDSISPFWEGAGGVKSIVDNSRQADKFKKWGEANPQHAKIIGAITACPIHLFCTMRAKVGYAMNTNSEGKTEIVKLGMQPIQRDNMEYEFDVLVELDQQHAGKLEARGSFADRIVPLPGITLGEELRVWLDAGGGMTQPDTPAAPAPAETPQLPATSGAWQDAPHVVNDAGQVGMISGDGGKFWVEAGDVDNRMGEGWRVAPPRSGEPKPDPTPTASDAPSGSPAPAGTGTPTGGAATAGLAVPPPPDAGTATDEQLRRVAAVAAALQEVRSDIQWVDYLNTVAGERWHSTNGVQGLTREQCEELIELAEQTRLAQVSA